MDYLKTAKHESKAAHRSLGLLITKVAQTSVETGRYDNIPFHERLCEYCNAIKTQGNCLLECFLPNDIRHTLLEKIREVFSDFDNFVMSEKLSVFLSDTRFCFTSAKICNLILSRSRKIIIPKRLIVLTFLTKCMQYYVRNTKTYRVQN